MRARLPDIESPAILLDSTELIVPRPPIYRHRPRWVINCITRKGGTISIRVSVALSAIALLALLLVAITAWIMSPSSSSAADCPCTAADSTQLLNSSFVPSDSSSSAAAAALLSSFFLLCPAAHDSPDYNLSAAGYAGSWHQLLLPTSPASSWVIHEVDVDLTKRQLRVPIIILDRTKSQYAGHAWISKHKEADRVLKLILDRAGLRVTIGYEDATQDVVVVRRSSYYKSKIGPTSYLKVTLRGDVNSSQQQPHSIEQPADGVVDYFVPPSMLPLSERPIIITLQLDWAAAEVSGNSSGIVSRAVLPLCVVQRPMVYSAAVLKPVIGDVGESHLLQWVDYHSRVGVDHFYIIDRNSECNAYPKLQQLTRQGLVTLIHWPLPYPNDPHDTSHKRGETIDSAQQAVYWAIYIRSRRVVRWMLAVDMDEYVYLNTSYYPRTCSNSLLCPSPLRDFVQHPSRVREGVVVFGRYNFVGVPPPSRYWNDSNHAWRYRIIDQQQVAAALAANHSSPSTSASVLPPSATPYAVSHVWRSRAPIDVDPVHSRNRYGKYLYRCDRGVIYLGVHSASHRDSPTPPAEGPKHLDQVWAAHYRDIYSTRSRVEEDRWDEQWEMDTRVADVMQLPLPPTNSDGGS